MKDLEFHYIVSCQNGAWSVVVEEPFMPEGTMYDWSETEWRVPNEEEEALDLENYQLLYSAIRQLNGESE